MKEERDTDARVKAFFIAIGFLALLAFIIIDHRITALEQKAGISQKP